VDPSWLPSEPAAEVEPVDPSPGAAAGSSRMPTLVEVQRDAILRALDSSNGIIGGSQGAAALLGLKRTTLQARMQKLGIAPRRPSAQRTAALPSAPDTCLAGG
jgi:formate hydrogenlyase transcriptional activator